MEQFEIGSSLETMVNVETLVTSPASRRMLPPMPLPPEWPVEVNLPSGHIRRMGFPRHTWHWGFMWYSHFEALMAYCPGESAQVYIKTRKWDGATITNTWAVYRAVMRRPQIDPEAGRIKDFSLVFIIKEEIPVVP